MKCHLAPVLIMTSALLSHAVMAEDKISILGVDWTVPDAHDWKVSEDGGTPMLQLLIGRGPAAGPRKPGQFALLETVPVTRAIVEADVRPTKRSLIIVFAFQDSEHFDYVHFSTDDAVKQPVHNGVFHVYGGERVRISPTEGPPAFGGINQWFHLKVDWNGKTGEVKGYINGTRVPALHAFDLSLKEGRIGVGSFDETADFKNFRMTTF